MTYSAEEMEEFKAESLELLENAEKNLLSMDNGGDFRTAFDSLFRCFHNLKGAAGMMELLKLQSHTHKLEEILMGFKDGSEIPKPHINLFLRGIDASRALIDGVEVDFDFNVSVEAVTAQAEDLIKSTSPTIKVLVEEQKPAKSELPREAIEEFLSECDEIIERISNNLQIVESGHYKKKSIDEIYRDIHSLKGSAYLFSYKKMGDLAHYMESSLEKVRNGSHSPSKALINALFRSLELVEKYVSLTRSGALNPTLDLLIPGIEKMLTWASEDLPPFTHTAEIEKKDAPEVIDEAQIQLIQPETLIDEAVSQPILKEVQNTGNVKEKESEGASSIRVHVALLDNLMTLMGEMVLVRNQVLQFSNKSEDLEFISMSKRLNVVTSEIHGEMMKTRMQPIGNILGKFNRVVRDLSQELRKNINLTLSGSETELDKSLLETIKDPLTHIVRNSCDHGIETPDLRRKNGKTEVGNISIKAYHEGGQVIIEIQDDGKGLHRDVILKKAIEKGLVAQADAAQMTEKQVFNLIFEPGFSTAAQITNVSGRGVGMDVVRTNIERIGGTVELASVPGVGTTTKFKIPLTLAIIPALIVNSGSGTYAIPQVRLDELVRVEQSSVSNKIEMLHGAPVFRLRGNILPLVDLNNILNPDSTSDYRDGTLNIAVLNAEQISFGLIIDRIQDTVDIVVKPLNRLIKSLQIYSGATVLGDGSVALILDVPGIAKVARLGSSGTRNHENTQTNADKPKTSADMQDYLLVRLQSPTKHAFVLGFVHRLEEFKRSAVEYSGSVPVVRYRDVILPLVSVNEQLGYKSVVDESKTMSVIVVKKAEAMFGLIVDEIVDTLATAADLDAKVSTQNGIFGSLNTPTELIVVIDPFDIIDKCYPEAAKNPDSAPVRAAANSIAPVAPPKHPHLRNILLAEDTAFFRQAVKTLLEKAGYKVVCANDGKEAIDLLNDPKYTFDLIVSDIEMPRVNGFQLAEAVRKHPTHSTLPMLAVSSRADTKSMEDGIKAGFDLYLEKLKPAILLNAVSELFDKGRRAA